MSHDQTRTTDRWEYTAISQGSHEGENLSRLNVAGAEGWELVHVGKFSYLMKRKVP